MLRGPLVATQLAVLSPDAPPVTASIIISRQKPPDHCVHTDQERATLKLRDLTAVTGHQWRSTRGHGSGSVRTQSNRRKNIIPDGNVRQGEDDAKTEDGPRQPPVAKNLRAALEAGREHFTAGRYDEAIETFEAI